MAKFVSEHSAQLVVFEGAHRVRRDDDQVSAARERVQIVVIDDPHGEVVLAQVPRLDDLVESSLEFRCLVDGGLSGTDHAGEQLALGGRDEQHGPDREVDQRHLPVGDGRDERDRPPNDDDGEEPHRHDREHRHEGRHGRQFDVAPTPIAVFPPVHPPSTR